MEQSELTHEQIIAKRVNSVIRPDEIATVIKQQFSLVNSPDSTTRTQSRDIFFSYLYGFAHYHTDFATRTGINLDEFENYKYDRFSEDIPADAISVISDFINLLYPLKPLSPSRLISSFRGVLGDRILTTLGSIKEIFWN